MRDHHLLVCVVALALSLANSVWSEEDEARNAESYLANTSAEEVYICPSLKVQSGKFTLEMAQAYVVPIKCELGATGAVLIGDGTFSYAPDEKTTFKGEFHSAMLRFNPKDADAVVALDKAKKTTDHGIHEMSRHLLNVVFQHCWHRDMEALIPPPGSLAAVLYSKEYGDLLISWDEKRAVVYSFTRRQALLDRK